MRHILKSIPWRCGEVEVSCDVQVVDFVDILGEWSM
jgi:hypothetical protein